MCSLIGGAGGDDHPSTKPHKKRNIKSLDLADDGTDMKWMEWHECSSTKE